MKSVPLDPQRLCQALEGTLSHDEGLRKSAEKYLEEASLSPGLLLLLLQIVQHSQVDIHVRTAAAVKLKNEVKLHYGKLYLDDEEEEEESSISSTNNSYAEQDKAALKTHLFAVLVEVIQFSQPLSRQLLEVFRLVSLYDFPKKWPTLLPLLLQSIKEQQSSAQLSAALSVFQQLFKTYEYKRHDRVVLDELLVENSWPLLLQVAQKLLQEQSACMPASSAAAAAGMMMADTTTEALTSYSNMLKVICKIYWSVTQISLSAAPVLLHSLDQWMAFFEQILLLPVYSDNTENSEQLPALMKAKKWTAQILQRFFSRFGPQKTRTKQSRRQAAAVKSMASEEVGETTDRRECSINSTQAADDLIEAIGEAFVSRWSARFVQHMLALLRLHIQHISQTASISTPSGTKQFSKPPLTSNTSSGGELFITSSEFIGPGGSVGVAESPTCFFLSSSALNNTSEANLATHASETTNNPTPSLRTTPFISGKKGGFWLSDRIIQAMLEYLTVSVESAKIYSALLKPQGEFLVLQLCVPLMHFTQKDEELWAQDPLEFIRTERDGQIHCAAGPRDAAGELIQALVRYRGRDFLEPLSMYIDRVLRGFPEAVVVAVVARAATSERGRQQQQLSDANSSQATTSSLTTVVGGMGGPLLCGQIEAAQVEQQPQTSLIVQLQKQAEFLQAQKQQLLQQQQVQDLALYKQLEGQLQQVEAELQQVIVTEKKQQQVLQQKHQQELSRYSSLFSQPEMLLLCSSLSRVQQEQVCLFLSQQGEHLFETCREVYQQVDGALRLLSCLSERLTSKKKRRQALLWSFLKNHLLPLLLHHPHKQLRLRACVLLACLLEKLPQQQPLHHHDSPSPSPPHARTHLQPLQPSSNQQHLAEEGGEVLVHALKQILVLLEREQELPVRVHAAASIRLFLLREEPELRTVLQQHLKFLTQHLFAVLRDSDNEDVIRSIEELVNTFEEEVAPFAKEINQALIAALLTLLRKNLSHQDDEDDAAFTAIGIISAIRNVLNSVNERPGVYKELLEDLCLGLNELFKPQSVSLIDDALQLLAQCTAHAVPPFPAALWRHFETVCFTFCKSSDINMTVNEGATCTSSGVTCNSSGANFHSSGAAYNSGAVRTTAEPSINSVELELGSEDDFGEDMAGWAADSVREMVVPLMNFMIRDNAQFSTLTTSQNIPYKNLVLQFAKKCFEELDDSGDACAGGQLLCAMVASSWEKQTADDVLLAAFDLFWNWLLRLHAAAQQEQQRTATNSCSATTIANSTLEEEVVAAQPQVERRVKLVFSKFIAILLTYNVEKAFAIFEQKNVSEQVFNFLLDHSHLFKKLEQKKQLILGLAALLQQQLLQQATAASTSPSVVFGSFAWLGKAAAVDRVVQLLAFQAAEQVELRAAAEQQQARTAASAGAGRRSSAERSSSESDADSEQDLDETQDADLHPKTKELLQRIECMRAVEDDAALKKKRAKNGGVVAASLSTTQQQNSVFTNSSQPAVDDDDEDWEDFSNDSDDEEYDLWNDMLEVSLFEEVDEFAYLKKVITLLSPDARNIFQKSLSSQQLIKLHEALEKISDKPSANPSPAIPDPTFC